MKNKKEITKIANRILNDKRILLQKYASPEEVLSYLQNKDNFKRLPDILKETMIKAKICQEKDSQSVFIRELYSRIIKQDPDAYSDKKSIGNLQKSVHNWMEGKVDSIRYRYNAIEICFALNLNIDLSETFLNKCGFSGFNIRSYEDATYFYCILCNHSLLAAKKIISDYNLSNQTIADKPVKITNHSGYTTLLVEDTIKNTNWDSDEAFLSYLLNNKNDFTGFSFNALNEYYKWKNNLWVIVISDYIENELESIKMLSLSTKDVPKSTDFFPILHSLNNALDKCNESSLLYNASILLKESSHDVKSTWNYIKNDIIERNTDLESRKEISDFLSEIIKPEGLIKQTIDCLLNATGRIARRGKSSLNNSVMKQFPIDDTFQEFEKNPTIINSLSVRKAIILMYYISYSYEFTFSYLTDDNPSNLFSSFGFDDFLEGLNNTLSNCNLPIMYPANQFDWLILRSIREFDICPNYSIDNGDPIAFFNDVLSFSFSN